MFGMRRREFITLLGGAAAMAARGARAAARANAARRRANCRHADEPDMQARIGGVSARAGEDGLERRPKRADRNPLGREQCPTTSANMQRNWSRSQPDVIVARSGLDLGGAATGDPHRADRVRAVASIRWAPASLTAWRGRAATPPAFSNSNTT